MLNKGFTILELLVTIAVIGILSIMAAPTFFESIHQHNLVKSANELVSILHKGQQQAIRDKKVITVDLGGTSTPSDTVLLWLPYGSTSIAGGPKKVYFGPNGFPQRSLTNAEYAGVVNYNVCDNLTIGTSSFSKRITINRVGVVIDSGILGGCNAK